MRNKASTSQLDVGGYKSFPCTAAQEFLVVLWLESLAFKMSKMEKK